MKLLILLILLPLNLQASQERQAMEQAVKAFYIQSGMEIYVQKLDKKYTPEVVHEYGGWAWWAGDCIVRQQILYKVTWTFP